MLDVSPALPTATRHLVATLLRRLVLSMEDGGLRPPADGPAQPGSSTPTTAEQARSARIRSLVALAQEGDHDAFGALYEEYVGVVYRYAYLRTHDQQLAEDLTSETFLRALRRLDTFVWQGRDIAAWFLTITRNLMLDSVKSAAFRLEISSADLPERPTEDSGSPESRTVSRERAEWLLDGLRALTQDQAECLVLRFMEGLSLAETAQILGRNENAVKQLQLRAVRALRRELGVDL